MDELPREVTEEEGAGFLTDEPVPPIEEQAAVPEPEPEPAVEHEPEEYAVPDGDAP